MVNEPAMTYLDHFLNKKHHLFFWVCYFFFWMSIVGSWTLDGVIIQLIYILITGFPAYVNLYFLMPRYLYKHRYLAYTSLLLLKIIVFSVLLGYVLFGYFVIRDISPEGMFDFKLVLGPTLGAVSTSVILTMILKLVSNLVESEKKNRNLEHEKVQDELRYLKSQLNPHFLFNALNNIYFLIKKDQDKAADSLAKFSDMMRYQLYECNEDKIPLEQEVAYLTNYMEIVTLGKEECRVKTRIEVSSNGELITPLILIPFVENAFKHVGKNKKGENFISIFISKMNNELICQTSNSIGGDVFEFDRHEGIGLKNVKRRLSLAYPDKHSLDLDKTEGYFSTNLKLEL